MLDPSWVLAGSCMGGEVANPACEAKWILHVRLSGAEPERHVKISACLRSLKNTAHNSTDTEQHSIAKKDIA